MSDRFSFTLHHNLKKGMRRRNKEYHRFHEEEFSMRLMKNVSMHWYFPLKYNKHLKWCRKWNRIIFAYYFHPKFLHIAVNSTYVFILASKQHRNKQHHLKYTIYKILRNFFFKPIIKFAFNRIFIWMKQW